MANVDFGPWNPTAQARAEIEEQAAKLPAGWNVSLEMKSDASRCMSVIVEGDRADYVRTFDYGRFDLIASFLESLAQPLGRRAG